MSRSIWHALIKTHHITSRKKVAKLRKAARQDADYVLIRSGGSPGIMYVESHEEGVKRWVNAVADLRYKDYHLVCKPAPMSDTIAAKSDVTAAGFDEAESVQQFSHLIEKRGLLQWWREGFGYSSKP